MLTVESGQQRVSFAYSSYWLIILLFVIGTYWCHVVLPMNTVSYERDIWHHMAVIDELQKSLFHARNPHVVSDEPSRFFTPWGMFIAFLGRLFAWQPQVTLGFGAVINATLLGAGMFLFALEKWKSPWAAFILFAAIFGTWGVQLNHTGFHTIATVAFSFSYPFAFVFAAQFGFWWFILRCLRSHTTSMLSALAIALLVAVMFTTHQLQTAFALGAAAMFALFDKNSSLQRQVLILAACAAGIILSKFWWYFDPVKFVFEGSLYSLPPGPDFMSAENTNFVQFLVYIGFAMFGVLGFYDRGNGTMRWDLALGAAAIFGGIVVFFFAGSWMYGRFFPFLVLFLQFGIVSLVVSLMDQSNGTTAAWRYKAAMMVLTALLAFSTLLSSSLYLQAMQYQKGRTEVDYVTWGRNIPQHVQAIQDRVERGSTFIGDEWTAFPLQAYDLKVVAIPRIFPLVSTMLSRMQDNTSFLSPGMTVEQRCEILRKYDVKGVVYRPSTLDRNVQKELEAFGRAEQFGGMSAIFVSAKDDVCTKS